MLAQPKATRGRKAATPIHEIGKHPVDEEPVNVYDGPYGPYIKHGKVNVSVPEGKKPQEVTLEEAVKLLEDKGGPVKKKTKRKTAAKKTTKKSTTKKTTAKKSTTKKTTTKKATTKTATAKKSTKTAAAKAGTKTTTRTAAAKKTTKKSATEKLVPEEASA